MDMEDDPQAQDWPVRPVRQARRNRRAAAKPLYVAGVVAGVVYGVRRRRLCVVAVCVGSLFVGAPFAISQWVEDGVEGV